MRVPLIISTAVICLLTACEKENRSDCFTSAGEDATEVRQLPAFDAVYTEDRVNLEFRNHTEYKAEVTFGENIVKHIRTEVVNGELRIGNNARCNWVRDLGEKPSAVIYAPGFSKFENRGSGDILFSDTLRTNRFLYEEYEANGKVNMLVAAEEVELLIHTGRTELTISGRAASASLYTAGQGRLNGSGLRAQIALVNNSSFQDMQVNVAEYLYTYIGERGNVCYFGNPGTIDADIEGSGILRSCE